MLFNTLQHSVAASVENKTVYEHTRVKAEGGVVSKTVVSEEVLEEGENSEVVEWMV